MFVIIGHCSCCNTKSILGVYSTHNGFICKKCDPQTYSTVNNAEL